MSPNVSKLLHLVMLHLITIAACKQSFSLIGVLKSHARSNAIDKRLDHLFILKIYPDNLIDINLEDVIAEFASRSDSSLCVFRHAKGNQVFICLS